MTNIEVMFSSKNDDWSTPQDFFDNLNQEFNFTLDPCADIYNHKCEKYYTEEDDGLSKSWEGEIVFCNPPYSDCALWMEKCYNEAQKPNTTIVALIPSRTDTKYFHNFIYPFWNGNKRKSKYYYAAGIIDGEGCVDIQEHKYKKVDGTIGLSYSYRIGVKMTDLTVVEYLRNIFQRGNIYTEKRPEPYKDCYKWEVNGNDAYEVSRIIYPLSITKQEQLMFGMEYYQKSEDLTAEEKTYYYNILRDLKKKPIPQVGVSVEIRFIKGRLKFGNSKNSAPFPSMVVIYRGPEE